MPKIPCAPLPEQPPAASTLSENHDQLTPPCSQLMTVQMDLYSFGFLFLTLVLCPQDSPASCPASLLVLTHEYLHWRCFAVGFPSAMTTHSLLLLVRLHFSYCFHTSFTAPTSRWEPPTPCGPGVLWVLCYSVIDIYNTSLCWLLHKIPHPWCWRY